MEHIRSPKGKHTRGSGRPGHRLGRLLPVLLICIGAALLLCAGGVKLYTDYQRSQLLNAYANAPQQPAPTPQGNTPGQPMIQGLTQNGELMDPDEADGSPASRRPPEVIGVLRIPKLKLNVAISAGVTRRSLRYTVGHFTGTALPGMPGNFAITGHRNYVWGEFFNRLDELEAGDIVTVESGEKVYTYTVTDSFVVEPKDTWVLEPGDGHELTLITCTPVRVATHRLIVKATLNY